MRVGYLAESLAHHDGIARSTREILRALGRRDDVELVPVIPHDASDVLASLELDNLADVVTLGGRSQVDRALWEQLVLGRHLERAGVDVVHGAKHVLPRTRLPTVLTAHDVTLLSDPSQFRLAKRLLLPSQYRAALTQADVLLPVSAATRARLAALRGEWGGKCIVVRHGVSPDIVETPPAPVPELEGRRFALAVGDLSPRKNVRLLVELWPSLAGPTDDLMLVLAGGAAWRADDTVAALDALEREGRARWCRGLTDAQLRWLYEHATVVLYPSREEGFGLPVVEALALGAPVVASTDPALVEVANGHATHLDPDDSAGWAEAIATAAALPVTDRGPRPLPWLPSWDDSAAQVVGAYREAIERHTRRGV